MSLRERIATPDGKRRFVRSIFATIAAMYALSRGHRFGFIALLGFGVIGYCIFHFREFFPPRAAKVLADPAPNPWPHRLFWLIVALFALPPRVVTGGVCQI